MTILGGCCISALLGMLCKSASIEPLTLYRDGHTTYEQLNGHQEVYAFRKFVQSLKPTSRRASCCGGYQGVGMGQHGKLATDEEVSQASKAGFRGAVVGAARWGLYTGLVGLAAYFYSPVYRSLTVQYKVFLQMSGMTAGSVIEADRRMRDYEKSARRMRKIRRDHAVWARYEQDFEEDVKDESTHSKSQAQSIRNGPS